MGWTSEDEAWVDRLAKKTKQPEELRFTDMEDFGQWNRMLRLSGLEEDPVPDYLKEVNEPGVWEDIKDMAKELDPARLAARGMAYAGGEAKKPVEETAAGLLTIKGMGERVASGVSEAVQLPERALETLKEEWEALPKPEAAGVFVHGGAPGVERIMESTYSKQGILRAPEAADIVPAVGLTGLALGLGVAPAATVGASIAGALVAELVAPKGEGVAKTALLQVPREALGSEKARWPHEIKEELFGPGTFVGDILFDISFVSMPAAPKLAKLVKGAAGAWKAGRAAAEKGVEEAAKPISQAATEIADMPEVAALKKHVESGNKEAADRVVKRLEERFADNPERLAAVKEHAGIKPVFETEAADFTELPEIELPLDDDHVNLLKIFAADDKSKGAVESARAFFPEEMRGEITSKNVQEKIFDYFTGIYGEEGYGMMEQVAGGRKYRAGVAGAGESKYAGINAREEKAIRAAAAAGDADDVNMVAGMVENRARSAAAKAEAPKYAPPMTAEVNVAPEVTQKASRELKKKAPNLAQGDLEEHLARDLYTIRNELDETGEISAATKAALYEKYGASGEELVDMVRSGEGEVATISRERFRGEDGKVRFAHSAKPGKQPKTKAVKKPELEVVKGADALDDWTVNELGEFKGVLKKAGEEEDFIGFALADARVKKLRDNGLLSQYGRLHDGFKKVWTNSRALEEARASGAGGKVKRLEGELRRAEAELDSAIKLAEANENIVNLYGGLGFWGGADDALDAMEAANTKLFNPLDKKLTDITDKVIDKTFGAGGRAVARKLEQNEGYVGNIWRGLEYYFDGKVPEEIYIYYKNFEAKAASTAEHTRRVLDDAFKGLGYESRVKIYRARRGELAVEKLSAPEKKALGAIEEQIAGAQEEGLRAGSLSKDAMKGAPGRESLDKIQKLESQKRALEKSFKGGERTDAIKLKIEKLGAELDAEKKAFESLGSDPNYIPELKWSKEMGPELEKALKSANIYEEYKQFLGTQRSLEKNIKQKTVLHFERMMKRKKIDKHVRDHILGTIEDPLYNAAVGVYELRRNSALMEFFDLVAASEHAKSMQPKLANGRLMPGWVKVEGEKFGSLNGLWVQKSVHDELTGGGMKWVNSLPLTYRKMLSLWKKSKTIYQPSTHIRNFLSNYFLADNAGFDALNPANAKTIKEAFETTWMKKGKWFEEVKFHDFLNTNFAEQELKEYTSTLLREWSKPLSEQGNILAKNFVAYEKIMNEAGVMRRAGRGAVAVGRWADKKLTNLYAWEDQVWRAAVYIDRRKAGLSQEEAMKYALYWMLDYGRKSRVLDAASKTAMPFATFVWKSTPVLLHGFARRPWKAAKWALMFQAVNDMATTGGFNYGDLGVDTMLKAFGVKDDELDVIEKYMPKYLQGGFGVKPYALVPGLADLKKGRIVAVDTRYNTPFEGILALSEFIRGGSWPSALASIRHPFVDFAYGITTGRDVYFGKPIWKGSEEFGGGDTDWNDREYWLGDYKHPGVLAHASRTFLPNYAPGGYGFDRIYRAHYGLKDSRGRDLGMGEQLMTVFGGIKLHEFKLSELREERRRDIDFKLSGVDRDMGDLWKRKQGKMITGATYKSEVQSLKKYRKKLEAERRKFR